MAIATQFHANCRGNNRCHRCALESTVISHGLPYPHNLRLALRLEEIVREGARRRPRSASSPARSSSGWSRGQIEHLATAPNVRKVSRRDLPIVVARKLDGATTVATTAWAAHRAGIQVFATGGIGGVHRTELRIADCGLRIADTGLLCHRRFRRPARAGANAHHRRVRGGQGDPGSAGDAGVAGDARRDRWSATGRTASRRSTTGSSGLPVDVRADTPEEVAALFRAQRALGLPCGMLVTVPVPGEFELPTDQMEAAIAQALGEAEAQGIKGKALTPFLLARISELTGEASLRANLALLENNARIAAEIAVTLADDGR